MEQEKFREVQSQAQSQSGVSTEAKPSGVYEGKQFASLQEELDYLRTVVQSREQNLTSHPESEARQQERANIIDSEIADYSVQNADRVLHEHYKMPAQEQWEIILDLAPEMHDKRMEGLMEVMQEKGVLNAIQVARGMNSPHIDGDFHRFLVEYLKKGYPYTGLKETLPVAKALKQTLYEVALPEPKGDADEKRKNLKELISSMEQFYAGMLSVSTGGKASYGTDLVENQFSIELAVSNGGEEFVFYVAVPDQKRDIFEKQFLSIFPNAKLAEKKDNYNIFNEEGISVGSTAKQVRREIFPIKTYEQFDYDPLNVILNALSKIQKDGEGAAIQIMLNPAGDYYNKQYKEALDAIQKGDAVKKATDIRHTLWGNFTKGFKELTKETYKEITKGDKEKKEEPKVIDSIAVEQITTKIQTPVIESNIRVLVSAESRPRAEDIISGIESAFGQFENSLGNALKFERVKDFALAELTHNYSYRLFDKSHSLAISTRELTTIMHFPTEAVAGAHQLKQSKAGSAPAPLGLPGAMITGHDGLTKQNLFLGTNKHRNIDTPIYVTPEDRLRHFYVIGQTGTGKSTMLRNMIMQDINNGDGVCFIDPHGSDVQDILAHIPKERYEDVIYFDPSHVERPMSLNMLEYNRDYPEQKTFVVNELFSIFQKLYGGVPESMGPMFEQYFRNATMLVIEDPDSGCTLLDVSRVMAVKSFRDMKIARCKNPIVVQFWKDIAEKAGGEGSLQNMVPYITSKFDVFLANDIMRPIIAQEKSSFNFREIMDSKKILLVNLAKGRLGDINSSLIGLILVGKILMAALSRVDSFGKDMAPFYLYIDEFQNITTPSISTILSEARKYKLSLTMAHQFIAQLDEKIKDAVFGNVGNMSVFRVGAEDAEFLEKQFEPVFTSNDIMNIDNMNCYVKMLSGGKPVRPFNVEFTWPSKGNPDMVENLKELSYLKYGQDRSLVEDLIMEKYKKEPAVAPASQSPSGTASVFGMPPMAPKPAASTAFSAAPLAKPLPNQQPQQSTQI
ncbi:MAG: TraM recognition domain-containing protein [Candidatus Pacebacteria bacterium]|nr:TraM recognition domain-containing protein [Candidatus Paceibacterota bacterium]